jgi:chromosome segregation ATPase
MADDRRLESLERRIEQGERRSDFLEQSMHLLSAELSGLRQMGAGLIDADRAKGEAVTGLHAAYAAAAQRAEVAAAALTAAEQKSERRIGQLERRLSEMQTHVEALERIRQAVPAPAAEPLPGL